MEDLYRENILEHYKQPRNWGTLEDPDLEFEDNNPLCGDELKVQLKVEDEGAVEAQHVVDLHPLDLLGGQRRRRLRDRAAVAAEAQLGDAVVGVEVDHHLQLVAAQRVVVLEDEVGVRQLAEVPRPLVVIEDLLAVEVVH